MKPRGTHVIALLIAGMLLVSAVWLYGPATEHELVYFDDTRYVIENRHVHAGLSPSTVAWAFETDHMGTWHPMTWLSHAADWSLYGSDAGGHHLTSVLLHALNGVLLFGLLFRATDRIWPSALVAFVFVVHPLNVSSVAWVSSRKGVLSTAFMLIALLAYASYVKRPTIVRHLGVMLAFALGLMSKPMLVSLPLVLLLLDVWPFQRMTWTGRALHGARPWLDKLPLAIMAVAVAGVAFAVRRTGEPVSWLDRILQAPIAILTYARRLVWPSGLATPYPALDTPSVALAALSLCTLLGATALALSIRRKRPYVAVGWFWFLVTLAPVIGIVQVGDQPMADRWMYVPMIGVLVAVAWTVDSWTQTGRTLAAVGVGALLLTVALAVQTRAQLRTWENTETLFRHAIAVTPDNRVAHYNLGWYLAHEGRHDEAAQHYRRAIEIAPWYFAPQFNLAWLLWEQGRVDEANEVACGALRVAGPELEAHRTRLIERLGDYRCR